MITTSIISFSGLSGSMEEDFFAESQLWKKFRQTRNLNAAHAQKRVTVPLTKCAFFMNSFAVLIRELNI